MRASLTRHHNRVLLVPPLLCKRIQCIRSFATTNIKVSRGGYGKVEHADIEYFKSALSSDGGAVLTNSDDVKVFNTDWMHKFHGYSTVVVRPKTTQQVSAILSHCNKRNLAVVPQGGNTGLVGGSVPVFDEVILSTGLMNKLESFDATSGVVVCQAGVVLEVLEKYLVERGFTVPLDLGAKGSCQIGGNVSTNAGGIRLLRYGSLHGNVLGLEVVLADGTILDGMSTLRKDNTGFDLKQIFIGAEGSLGVITKVSLLTPPRPMSVNVAFFGCQDFGAVKAALKKARAELGEILSAFEFLDRNSLECVLANLDRTRDPLQSAYPYYVLVETSGSNRDHDQEKLNKFLENIMGANIVADGVIAENASQAADIWKLRESIAEALQKAGAVYHTMAHLHLTVRRAQPCHAELEFFKKNWNTLCQNLAV